MSSEESTTRVPVKVPEIGSGDEPLRISAWLVDIGQTVIAGDRILEVLIPGITFDIEAPQTGLLVEITRPVDAVVQSGDIVAWIVRAAGGSEVLADTTDEP